MENEETVALMIKNELFCVAEKRPGGLEIAKCYRGMVKRQTNWTQCHYWLAASN